MFFIPIFTAIGLGLFFLIADGMCSRDVKKSLKRLEKYGHKEISLSSGNLTYVDRGKGDVILSIHGIIGGYDQGIDTAGHLSSEYRVISPSRFGFLGSEIPEDSSPKEQAKVFAELLDSLEVEQVYLLATCVGGAVAIRFALDYPERTKGLILYSTVSPFMEKPKRWPRYAGLPAFVCNNYGMYLTSLYFKPLMSMDREAIYSMLPVSDRREGLLNDATVTSSDMARNFDDYPIEDLQIPVRVFQAKDDKVAKYKQIAESVKRFSNCKFVVFEKGGHLLSGCGPEIDAAEKDFFKQEAEKQPDDE